jgi:hypothetical protein
MPRSATPSRPGPALRRATLELFRASDDPARDRHRLVDPLSRAVAWHKTHHGQTICAEIAQALAANAYDEALEACRALIALEADCAATACKWD